MPYKKLSEQLQELDNTQRSDVFVKRFRDAVREGQFDAMTLPERFTLPKQYSRRGTEGTYQREGKDMLFDVTPAFTQWFDALNAELTTSKQRGGKVKVSLDAVESGAVDFKALAEETRQKLQSRYAQGQSLGNSRKKTTRKKK